MADPGQLAVVQDLIARLRPLEREGANLVRAGSPHDGGYVVPDCIRSSTFLLSIGVGNDAGFENECAAHGARAFLFDHTISSPPPLSERCTFQRLGWGSASSGPLRSLSELIRLTDMRGEVCPILKFDVEGAEWPELRSLGPGELARFDVIIAELHWFGAAVDPDTAAMMSSGLDAMLADHQVVHLHANNCAGVWRQGEHAFPNVVEVTLWRKSASAGKPRSLLSLPIPLDHANDPTRPDIAIVFGGARPMDVSTTPPNLPPMRPPGELAVSRPGFGINLIGNLTGGVGLGVITRAVARLLRRRKLPFSVLDVPHAWGTPQHDPELSRHQVYSPGDLRYPVNLYILPSVFYENFFENNPGLLISGRVHIANLWWEASQLPPHWLGRLSRFDGILAMSQFIANLCRNSLPMTPTLFGEAPIDLPEQVQADRRFFGLPEDAVVFVASLDPNSDPERKNPDALVSAFKAAFPADDNGVRLVIRLNNAETELGRQTVDRLLRIADGDRRVGLVLEPLDYGRVLSLYASADVYLSFHRGEGLGLGLLESMALGKPVVATGWSGNLDFMNHENSALLRYRLIQVSGTYGFFRPEIIGHGAVWADPVIEDAVGWMRHLRHDDASRQLLGERARQAAMEYRCRAESARWLDEIAELWRTRGHLPRVLEKLSSASAAPAILQESAGSRIPYPD